MRLSSSFAVLRRMEMKVNSIRNSIAQSTPEKRAISNGVKVHIMFVLVICGINAVGNSMAQSTPEIYLATVKKGAISNGVKYSAAAQKMMEGVLVYRGTSDASAAVALSKNMFIVADDENNILRVYRTDKLGLPVFSYDLTSFLDIEPEHPEADIEGAASIGDRIYWITSHGRNKDGKLYPNRYRFFATTVKVEDDNIIIHPVGVPCKNLVQGMLKAENMRHLGLDKATRFDAGKLSKKERQKLAPKEQGLNIEGLCASADGRTLYIGFRNPQIYEQKSRVTKALVVPLKNPDAVIESLAAPIFGEPILWNLGGLGIRSMEYSRFYQTYFIIAGPHDESSKFVLYRWSGKADEPPRFVRDLHTLQKDFIPEALVCFKNSGKLLIISDDGSLDIKVTDASECMEGKLNGDGTCPNKFLVDTNKKTFRAIWLTP
jgi:hypothetical protein